MEQNTIWQMIQRIERAFIKDDITTAPREVLQAVIADTYERLCRIADSGVDWWERDDEATARTRNRILNRK